MQTLKKLFLTLATLFATLHSMNAQHWNAADSLWLKNVLEGKEELKLNSETVKAIEDGSLIVPAWMRGDKANLMELIKDFEDAAQRDSLDTEHIHPLSMPPSVFALYVLYMDKVDSINAFHLTDAEKERIKEQLPPGETTISIGNLGSEIPGGGLLIKNLDFNHALSMIFSSQYRLLQHNRKHATAWKYIYDEDAIRPPSRLTESEKRRLNNSIQNHRKVNVKVKTGGTIYNGIDD